MILLRSNKGEIAIMNVVEGADKDDAILKFMEQHPEFIDYYEGNFELPADRKFRDAWELRNNKVIVNDNKAKQIHLSHIREARNQKLIELDMEQLKHLTDNWKIQEIEQKKQILRDLTATIKVDINEWPSELI